MERYFEEILALIPSLRDDGSANGSYTNICSREFRKAWRDLISRWEERTATTKPGGKDLDALTLRWIIGNEKRLLRFPDEWMLLTSYENPILQFVVEDSSLYPLRKMRDAKDLISRTRARIPLIRDMMREMRESDRTIPRMICKKLVAQLDALLASRSYIVHLPKQLAKAKEEYLRVAEEEYRPVLSKLLEFLKAHEKRCRRSIGLCYVREGKEMYRALVQSTITLETTPEEIHTYGKQEMKRLYRDLASFQGDLLQAMGIREGRVTRRQLFQKILARESEYYHSSQEILHAYREAQNRIRRTVIPRYFGKAVQGYKVRPIPAVIQSSMPAAYYQVPSATSSQRPGTVFVNANAPKTSPKYVVDVLSLHEGVPGHHYQYQYMKEHRVPEYRIKVADNTAYTEGWALYSEGFLETDDPKLLFGRWIYDMLRTVRLVVDTGIHWYGWTYRKALAYLQRHVPLSQEELVTELDRYICDPGQALGYKIGERFFYTERDYFLTKGMGSIQDFHRRILGCGPMPLEVLRHKLRDEIPCHAKK